MAISRPAPASGERGHSASRDRRLASESGSLDSSKRTLPRQNTQGLTRLALCRPLPLLEISDEAS